MTKGLKKYVNKIREMSSEEILEEYTTLARGDDYDGYFTSHGKLEWEQLQIEFKFRLASHGFFGRRKVIIEKRPI